MRITTKSPSLFDNMPIKLHTPGTGDQYVIEIAIFADELAAFKKVLKERYLVRLNMLR